jgi:hypothetical protein
MEKRIQISFAVLLLTVFALSAVDFYPQNTIHIALWALRDALPGTEDAALNPDNPYTYSVKALRETAPFLIEGMVYGWEFSYTPSDIQRSVEEYFSFEPSFDLVQEDIQRIQYTKPWEENNKVNCWVDFPLSETMMLLRQQWSSVSYKRIKGRGYAPLANGFDGIKQASSEALKNAVREYARALMKNKPKEITGRVLVVNNPSIALNAGRYQIELDFFVELSTIVSYNLY